MSESSDSASTIGRRHRCLRQLALLVYDYDQMVIKTASLPAHHIFQPWRPCNEWRGKRISITLGDSASEFDWGLNTGKATFLGWNDFFANCQLADESGPWDVILDLSELLLLESAEQQASEDAPRSAIIPYTELLVKDDRRRTRLFYAAERGDQAAVEKMIYRFPGTGFYPQRLGFIESKDKDGLTAAGVAEQSGHQELADYLRHQAWFMENYG